MMEMMQSATATYIFNERTMRRGRYWHWFKKPLLVWLFPIAGLALLAIGFWLNAQNPQIPTAWVFPILGTYFLFRYWILGFRFERSIRAHPMYGYEMQWVVDMDGSTSISPNGESRVGWSHLYGVYVVPDGFLIYPQRELWVWVPKTAFKSEEEFGFVEHILMGLPVTKKL